MAPPDAQAVARARNLLKMRGQGNHYQKAAVERQISQLPPDVLAAAGAAAEHELGDLEGVHKELAQLHQGEGQKAVKDEVEAYCKAVAQGHTTGYSEFRGWYRGYKRAQEENISKEFATQMFEFLLKTGLDIVFPEIGGELVEEGAKMAMSMMKSAVEAGLKTGYAALTESAKKEDLEKFLDEVMTQEEKEITGLLDVSDNFMKTPVADKAVESFVAARLDKDKPWPHADRLPPQTLDILHANGFGGHGVDQANVVAERVLNAHIRSVLETEFTPDENFGMISKQQVETLALVQTLRKTGGLGNIELAWEADRQLPEEYRTTLDINGVDAMEMHRILQIDLDLAEKIKDSRHTVGQFGHPHDLVRRELLSDAAFEAVADRIVAHHK